MSIGETLATKAVFTGVPALFRKLSRRYSWGSFQKNVAAIHEQIERDMQDRTFFPEVVLGIEGGGVFVGGMLVTNFIRSPYGRPSLPIKFCVLNRTNHNEAGESKVGFTDCEQTRIAALVRGKHVLLVDATVFTGKTMSECRQFVDNCGAAQIKTATIYQGEGSSVSTDYLAKKTSKRKLFPWEISPLYKTLYGRKT